MLQGGYGLQIKAYVQEHYPKVQVLTIALPDAYVEHGNVSVLREELGIDSDSVIRTMRKAWAPLEDVMKAVESTKSECSEDAMMSAGQKNTEETARNGIIEEKEESK